MRSLPARPIRQSSLYHTVRPDQISPNAVYSSLTCELTNDPNAYLDTTANDHYSSLHTLNYENIASGYEYSDSDNDTVYELPDVPDENSDYVF